MKTRFAILSVLMIAAFQASCVVHTRKLPKDQVLLKAESSTKFALLDLLKKESGAVQTLMIKGSSLKVTRPKSKDEATDLSGSGIIAIERPDHISLEISKLVLTVADMVSDGKQYKVSLPHGSKKTGGPPKFGVNDVAASGADVAFPYSLRPNHILDALFVDGEQYFENPEILVALSEHPESQPDGIHSYYVLDFTHIPDSERIEEIWIDRSSMMEVSRKVQYKQGGKVEADIRYSNYDKVDNVHFPKTITINRPVENYVLEIKIEKMDINKPIPPSTFTLERPEGVIDVDLNTGKDIKSK